MPLIYVPKSKGGKVLDLRLGVLLILVRMAYFNPAPIRHMGCWQSPEKLRAESQQATATKAGIPETIRHHSLQLK